MIKLFTLKKTLNLQKHAKKKLKSLTKHQRISN